MLGLYQPMASVDENSLPVAHGTALNGERLYRELTVIVSATGERKIANERIHTIVAALPTHFTK